jgi:hypothetical protein
MLQVGSTSDMLSAFTPSMPPDVDQAAFEAQGLGLPSSGSPSPEASKVIARYCIIYQH